MKHGQAKLLLFALRLLQVLGAPSSPPPGAPPNLAPPVTQAKAKWTPCPATISTLLQCTNITVPLNYSDPHSSMIELTLAKSPSKQPSMRQGTLVFQNGGPGHETTSSIISYAQLNDSRTDNLNNWFDMVVAEPRGINYNHPVMCDEKYAFARAPLYPTTEEEWKNATEFFGEWGRNCLERTGEVMKHMDTWTQARDLEAVRLAIGEGGLNYCESYVISVDETRTEHCRWRVLGHYPRLAIRLSVSPECSQYGARWCRGPYTRSDPVRHVRSEHLQLDAATHVGLDEQK